MNTKRLLLLLGLLVLTGTISSFAVNTSDKKPTTIDMNRGQNIRFDDLVSDISCLSLQQASFDNCWHLIAYGDYYYGMVSTMAGRKLVIYDKQGALVKELTFSDAWVVHSMCIVPELKELWVMSRTKIINKFKLDGTPIRRLSLPFACTNVIPAGDGEYLVYSGGSAQEKYSIEKHMMALTDFKTVTRLYLPIRGQKDSFSGCTTLSATEAGQNLYVFPPGIDTIFTYHRRDKELYPQYALNFHGDFLPLEELQSGERQMARVIETNSHVYDIVSFYEAAGRLFFRLVGKRNHFCMIDLRTDSLYTFNHLFDYYDAEGPNPIVGSSAGKFYLVVREKALLDHYQNIKCSYPALKQSLSGKSSGRNGWLLITITLKQ